MTIGDGDAAQPPRVSVISIFLDAEAFLAEAIDSVLAQEFRDFELLLVDDGSSDSSSAIAAGYARRQPERIRHLEHPGHANRGMSASRNLGLRAARGEFVAFIDADDRWRPSKLGEQVGLLDRMPDVDAVCGSVNYWGSASGGKDRLLPTAHVRNRRIPPGEASLRLYPLGPANAPSMSDLLFRRASVDTADGFEEGFTGAYEDQAFLSKFYLESTLFVTGTVWSDYRLHPESCMARVKRDGLAGDARRAFLEWFESYLEGSRHRSNIAVHKALDRALRPYRAPSEAPAALARLTQAGRAALRRLRPWLPQRPAILMYHRIADERFDPWGLAVSPANFADQLDWIARNRTALPLAEFAELHRRRRLPRGAVAVTFDDGYACNAEVAMPLLDKFGIPATIFLPAELIERGREFWWDELERIALDHDGASLRLHGETVMLGDKTEQDGDWLGGEPPRTDRQRAYHRLWSILYRLPQRELEGGMQRLREQAQVPDQPRPSHRPLTVGEIRKMRSAGVDFGSHALTHPSLPLLDPAERTREIRQSVERCEALTGARPRSFAYPYGNLDAESQRLVEQAGFECACRADGGFVRRSSTAFILPRIAAGNWGAVGLARLLGAA